MRTPRQRQLRALAVVVPITVFCLITFVGFWLLSLTAVLILALLAFTAIRGHRAVQS
jgi:hypothetical protein